VKFERCALTTKTNKKKLENDYIYV